MPQTEPVPPLLPCLKERKWQGKDGAVCRALWEEQPSAFMPWLALGYDHPHTFEFLGRDRLAAMNATEQALEREAIENLAGRKASWQPFDVDVPDGKRLHLLLCTDDFFAAERILDASFMQEAQRELRAPGLLVGIPRRGLLLATSVEQDEQMVGAFGAVVAGQFSRGETAIISPMMFALKDGALVGIIEAVADAVVPEGEPAGAPEEEDQDDPNAPYITSIASRNDEGTEDIHLMAGGQDAMRLAKGIASGFMELLKSNAARKEFSGHIQVVVLGMTPPEARTHIPVVLEHLRGVCSELSNGARQFRVSLTYQRETPGFAADSLDEASDRMEPETDETPAAKAPWWRRLPGWMRFGAGARDQ
ncbi:MAG TPA: hypothetical protein VK886_14800 [Vicinamibacterales bacterium]|nr:hypothetical protein [Vicinamibacterales bacterium]